MRKRFLIIVAAALIVSCIRNSAQAADVICYNCPPQWADFAAMLKAIKADLGYDIPFDNKNSGQSLSQIIAELASDATNSREAVNRTEASAVPRTTADASACATVSGIGAL